MSQVLTALKECRAFWRVPIVRRNCPRLTVAVVVMIGFQLAGIWFGPVFMGWRWNPLWGGRDDLKMAGATILAAALGAIATRIALQLRKPPSLPELLLLTYTGVLAFPVVLGALAFASGLSQSMNAACYNGFIGCWILAFISFPSFACAPLSAAATHYAIHVLGGRGPEPFYLS